MARPSTCTSTCHTTPRRARPTSCQPNARYGNRMRPSFSTPRRVKTQEPVLNGMRVSGSTVPRQIDGRKKHLQLCEVYLRGESPTDSFWALRCLLQSRYQRHPLRERYPPVQSQHIKQAKSAQKHHKLTYYTTLLSSTPHSHFRSCHSFHLLSAQCLQHEENSQPLVTGIVILKNSLGTVPTIHHP